MQISYAQNLEDYHLWQAFGGATTGFYIDVGAGHPVADNVSFAFYEAGWRGLVVEPQAGLAAPYPKVRPRDVAIAALVGRSAGQTEFHVVDRLHGFSTTIEKHAASAQAFGANYSTIQLPMVTLAELCARHAPEHIDFLKIDVEGAEADVLAGNDWTRFRPKVVVCESVAPGSGEPKWESWEGELLAQGYRFALFDGLNRFYVAEEQPALFARFPKEKADWGVIRHYYEFGRAGEEASHPDHALALDLMRGLLARLPHLDPALLADLLITSRGPKAQPASELVAHLTSDAGRASLGRIAAGYDGGQLFDD